MAFTSKKETAVVLVQDVKKVDDASTACWKKKTVVSAATDVGFLANVKDHIDEFVSTPMDQHKICLKRTMSDFRYFIRQKKEEAFGSSKADGGSGDAGVKGVASNTAV